MDVAVRLSREGFQLRVRVPVINSMALRRPGC